MHRFFFFLSLLLVLCPAYSACATERVLDAALHHLRAGEEREWSDFPLKAEGPRLIVHFQGQQNNSECTLRFRQQDVRQSWKILLADKELGRLQTTEDDTVIYLPVPPGWLVTGENTLKIEQVGKIADDIRVGAIILDDRPVAKVLGEATVDIAVTEEGQPIPCRLTILNSEGALMTVGGPTGDHLAVRPGVIYTGNGKVTFGLPAGEYTINAGRGFAYGVDSVNLQLKPRARVLKKMAIRREVPTPGWISCDPHVHTFTYSGHGDVNIEERMLTLAGEEIELPIATDHNRHVDYQAMAVKLGVRPYFTPVIGNEVTTERGHFNIFPLHADDPLADFKLKDWKALAENIHLRTKAKVIILNHPRDVHDGFRPLGSEHFLSVTGERLDGHEMPANAIEVINSGSQASDFMMPFHDWFGLLNRGFSVTPIGASDSHDVSRSIVGQARTYIRSPEVRPGRIDVPTAVENLLQGRVLVSCGLLAEITVNNKYGPGDLAPPTEQIKVAVRVLGPSWVRADKVELFANGRKIREAKILPNDQMGIVKWSGEWVLPRFRHDVHLVAIASGPGVTNLFWPIAKPHQPTSPIINRRVIGATGAVWIDGDGDGKRTSAYGYAKKLFESMGPNLSKLIPPLNRYDETVAAQAASLLQAQGVSLQDPTLRELLRETGPQVEQGFHNFAEAWRTSQLARP